MNVRTAATTTAGTKYAGDAIGEPLNRRARPLRLGDHPHDLREQRVAADALRAHRERPVRRRSSRRSRDRPALLSTGIDSPVTIDSSTAALPSTTTPSTGIFSPGRTRSTSPAWTSSSGTSSSRPLRARGARSSARGRAAAGSPAPVRWRARSSSTWPSSTSTVMTTAGVEVGVDAPCMRKPAGTPAHRRTRCRRTRRRRRCPISVNMLGLRVDERLPHALEERPAAPEHDRRRQREPIQFTAAHADAVAERSAASPCRPS